MRVPHLFFILTACWVFLPTSLRAQIPPTPVATSAADEAEALYRDALKSYLDGDYDKAIISTAQSLEKDPNYEKSKNLLTLLSAEKENEGRTVIWLNGKQSPAPPASIPVPVQAPPPPSFTQSDLNRLQAEINSVRAQEEGHHRVQTLRTTQLAGQFDVMHDMMSVNSETQYQELRTSQVQLDQKLRKIVQDRWGGFFWVLLISVASLALSVFSIMGHGKKRHG